MAMAMALFCVDPSRLPSRHRSTRSMLERSSSTARSETVGVGGLTRQVLRPFPAGSTN